MQGLDKLEAPFRDTLSRYQLGHSGTIETTWDTVQRDVWKSLIHSKYTFRTEVVLNYFVSGLVRV